MGFPIVCCLIQGSPPHTRGIRGQLSVSPSQLGFTPAYAGNTSPHGCMTPPQRVHPRIRGEYPSDDTPRQGLLGSPPHTRGIRSECRQCRRGKRFTPAYAGNTNVSSLILIVSWVHPRIRGEYPRGSRGAEMPLGSPPHTRGIRSWEQDFATFEGFTPAYAGNTSILSTQPSVP